MSKRFSIKLSNISLICAILVVVIHAGTYAANLPGAELQTVYGRNAATFFQLFFTEGICRVAVPLFFMISGYLYYRNFSNTLHWHWKKLKKRMVSNGIPYLIWGIAVILLFLVAQMIPATQAFFSSSDRQIRDFSLLQWLTVIFIEPLNSPLWFLRDLLVLAILSPLVSFLCRKLRLFFPLIIAVIWIIFWEISLPFLRTESLLFFSLGVVVSLYHSSFAEKRITLPKWGTALLILLWLAIVTLKTVYLCGLDASILLDGTYDLLLDILSKINIFVGLVTLWIAYDAFGVSSVYSIAQYSFLLFVMHHPIIGVIKKLLLKMMGVNYTTVTIAFVLSIILTVGLVVAIGLCLKRLLPKFFGILTGGR